MFTNDNVTSIIANKLSNNNKVRLSLATPNIKNTMDRIGYGDCFRKTVCEKREAEVFHSGLVTLAHMAPKSFYKSYPGLLQHPVPPPLLGNAKPNEIRNFMLLFFKINGRLDVNNAYLNGWMYALTGKIQPSALDEFKKYFPMAHKYFSATSSENGRAFLAHAIRRV
jgi:hypothetical protein